MICIRRITETDFLSILDYGDVIYRRATPSVLKPLDSVNTQPFDLAPVTVTALITVSFTIGLGGLTFQKGFSCIGISSKTKPLNVTSHLISPHC